jgi:maltose O-acetyltransferase
MRSEKEKMVAGELYDAQDAQLVAERRRARDLLHTYNHSREGEQELRVRILRDLLGSSGGGVWIEPPFYCDYGSNVTLGENVYFNFNCVVLDVAPVRIGSRVMFGPGSHVSRPPTR